jgi:hypothetical protein
MRLADLVYPLDPTRFLNEVLGKKHHLFDAIHKSRFSNVFGWQDLNALLRDHHLARPQLRLVNAGELIDEDQYLERVYRGGSSATKKRIVPASLYSLLRNGATLILDSVDELHQPTRAFVRELERDFGERLQVNVYASFTPNPGFDLHWDDHDVLVLQAVGTKVWQIFGSSRSYPLFRDIEPNIAPENVALDSFELSAGQVLHLPRGCWHTATSTGDPSLHLTLGVNVPTGIDLLNWMIDSLRGNEQIRRDLPRWAGQSAIRDHLRSLHAGAQDYLSDERLLEKFLHYEDQFATIRQEFSLPYAAAVSSSPAPHLMVRWLPSRARIEVAEDCVSVEAGGKRWRFAPPAAHILGQLVESTSTTVGQLCDVGAELGLDGSTVSAFVVELIQAGLIVVM